MFSICSFAFQIAYRTASNKFEGRLSELFLVLSDDYPTQLTEEGRDEAVGFQPVGRGQKHRLEDDQMSVESGTKRVDNVSSAEKNQKNKSKTSKGRGK